MKAQNRGTFPAPQVAGLVTDKENTQTPEEDEEMFLVTEETMKADKMFAEVMRMRMEALPPEER